MILDNNKPVETYEFQLDNQLFGISIFENRLNRTLAYNALINIEASKSSFIFKDDNGIPYYFTNKNELIKYIRKLIEKKRLSPLNK